MSAVDAVTFAIVAEFVDLLALHARRLGQRALLKPIGFMNSSVRISPGVAGLRFAIGRVMFPYSVQSR